MKFGNSGFVWAGIQCGNLGCIWAGLQCGNSGFSGMVFCGYSRFAGMDCGNSGFIWDGILQCGNSSFVVGVVDSVVIQAFLGWYQV